MTAGTLGEFTFVLEQAEDGGWGAMCPDLPGMLLLSEVRETLFDGIETTITEYLDVCRERGLPMPVPGAHIVAVPVPAG